MYFIIFFIVYHLTVCKSLVLNASKIENLNCDCNETTWDCSDLNLHNVSWIFPENITEINLSKNK